MRERFVFDKKKMSADYLFITNRREIYQILKNRDRENVILLEDDLPKVRELEELNYDKKTGRFFILYCSSIEQFSKARRLINSYKMRRTLTISNLNLLPIPDIEEYKEMDGIWDEEDFLEEGLSLERFIEIMEQIVDGLDQLADGRGWIFHHEYTDRCGNCHHELEEDDKYCSRCGTKKGEGEFKPFNNSPYGLYGCPPIWEMKCPRCGREWVKSSGGDGPYCSECGHYGVVIKEKDGLWYAE